MQLLFTRHGESEANRARVISNRDLPHAFTPTGRAQAQALAARLVALNPVALYASPILRAQQTAHIVAEQLGLPIHTADALREFDCGVMEGQGSEAAWQAHHAVIQAWDAQEHDRCIPDGESFADIRARFVPFVEEIVRRYADTDGTVVLVSHGSVLHLMLPLVLTNLDRTFTQQHPLGNCACVLGAVRGNRLLCVAWDDIQFAA